MKKPSKSFLNRGLFSNVTNPCDLYRVIRDEGRCSKLKSGIEELWEIYYPYADGDFPKQLSQDFHARYWEMYLTCTLVGNSFNVVPKQGRSEGPDIKIEHASLIGLLIVRFVIG